MAILNEGYFCANSVNYLVLEGDFEYILGICNSKLMNWFFKKLSTNSNVNGYEIDNLPIAIAKDGIKEELSKMVSLLLENLLENADEMEKKIDEWKPFWWQMDKRKTYNNKRLFGILC